MRVVVDDQTRQWLDVVGLPDRSGQHRDTAWNLHQLRRYATAIADEELAARIDGLAVRLYRDDVRARRLRGRRQPVPLPVARRGPAHGRGRGSGGLRAVAGTVPPRFFDDDGEALPLPRARSHPATTTRRTSSRCRSRAAALADITPAVREPRVRERIDGLAVAHLERGVGALDYLDDYASGHWVPTFAIDALVRVNPRGMD